MTDALDALRSALNLSELSDADFTAFVRSRYPSGLVRELMDPHGSPDSQKIVRDLVQIRRAWLAFSEPGSPSAPRKRRKRRKWPLAAGPPSIRIERYISHVIVVAMAAAISAHDPTPLMLVMGLGVGVGVLFLLAKDVTASAIALTVRSRSRAGSVEVRVQLKGSSWDRTTAGRLLNVVAAFLPAEYRADYVEEQIDNLSETGSRREWLSYLFDQLFELPRTAWQFYIESKRESVR